MSQSPDLSDELSDGEYDNLVSTEVPQSQPPATATATNVVIFTYRNKNYIVPRPDSYEAAVTLFKEHVVPKADLSTRQVTFQARLPNILSFEDAEITPIAWDLVSKDISHFRVVTQDMASQGSDQPKQNEPEKPNNPDIVPSTSSDVIDLHISWTDGKGATFTIFVRPNTPFWKIKPSIERRTRIPVDRQLLVISRPIDESNRHIYYYVVAQDDDTPAMHNLKSDTYIQASWDPDKEN